MEKGKKKSLFVEPSRSRSALLKILMAAPHLNMIFVDNGVP